MKKLFIFSFLSILLFSCPGKETQPKAQPRADAFTFVESKKEPNAIMELYCPNGEFDSIALQKLCSEKKAKIKSGEYYLVVFDKKENAVFPSNPFSAQYGIDLDIMGHVLGFYTFVSSNMYSKLELWKEKGPGARIDIK